MIVTSHSNFDLIYILVSHILLLSYSVPIVYVYADQQNNKNKYKNVPTNHLISTELFATALAGAIISMILTISFVIYFIKGSKIDKNIFEVENPKYVKNPKTTYTIDRASFKSKYIKSFVKISYFINVYLLVLSILYLVQKGNQVIKNSQEPGSELTKGIFGVSIVNILYSLITFIYIGRLKYTELKSIKV